MAVVNQKDIPQKRNSLGQFFTPIKTALFCLSKTFIKTPLVIEPSCGKGVFYENLKQQYPNTKIIAFEVDETLSQNQEIKIMNFYDYNDKFKSDVTFVGNPPYRTPAISLTANETYGRKSTIKTLMKKYNVSGIKEEAVFFIVKSIDLILSSNVKGHIYYILPKSIFHNNSKAYKSFALFLKKYTKLISVVDINKEFDNVTTDLCYVHWEVGEGEETDFYGVNADMIPFQDIFKKTYLGSVPCESIFLSVRNEPKEHFKSRLIKLFQSEVNENNLLELLSYQNDVHLMSLRKRNPDKIKVVLDYVNHVKSVFDISMFIDDNNYKPIQHRNEIRTYFRHNSLKKANFLYQLNPNPCPSLYFPGNPSKGCLDYFGYCEFDVNRNCSPSANRTVPIDNIENNLTDDFKKYWDNSCGLPYGKVLDYIIHVLKSDWYKEMKNNYQRFYFGVPKVFDKTFKTNS